MRFRDVPKLLSWGALNGAIGGNLTPTEQFRGLLCYTLHYDGEILWSLWTFTTAVIPCDLTLRAAGFLDAPMNHSLHQIGADCRTRTYVDGLRSPSLFLLAEVGVNFQHARFAVRRLWQIRQTISHLSISAIIFERLPFCARVETLSCLSSAVWSKSINHGSSGYLVPQSVQDAWAFIVLEISRIRVSRAAALWIYLCLFF